jgi:hypothetical protein
MLGLTGYRSRTRLGNQPQNSRAEFYFFGLPVRQLGISCHGGARCVFILAPWVAPGSISEATLPAGAGWLPGQPEPADGSPRGSGACRRAPTRTRRSIFRGSPTSWPPGPVASHAKGVHYDPRRGLACSTYAWPCILRQYPLKKWREPCEGFRSLRSELGLNLRTCLRGRPVCVYAQADAGKRFFPADY